MKLIRSLLIAFTLAAVLSVAVSTAPTTYYVSLLGNDANSCATATSATQTNQKKTIAAGVACAVAGDTVLIHGGTYTGNGNQIDSQLYTVASGTSYSVPITIGGYTAETVILQPPYNVSGIRLTTSTPHYLIIQDIQIDMVNTLAFAEGVFMYQAHHIRMQRIDVSHGYGFGIHIADSTPYIELLHSRVHDVGRPSGIQTDGHGLYWSGSNAIIQYNELDHNQGWGVHLYCNNLCPSHADPSNGLIDSNDIHHNGLNGTGFGVVVSYGSDNQVSNNRIYQNKGGIQVYTDSTRTKVYNNTVTANTPYEGITSQYYLVAPTISQNIVYANGSDIITDSGTGYPGAGTPILANNVTTNPSFTNAAINDFTISSGPALDIATCITGITVDYIGTARPQGAGSKCEAGAYELSVAPLSPIISTLSLPGGQSGAIYSQTVCASGGTPPYLWSTSAGTVNAGLVASTNTALCRTLSGTLTTAGTYTFTFLVTDAAALTDSHAFTVVTTAAPATTCSGGSGVWALIANTCGNAGSAGGTATATTTGVTSTAGDIAFCARVQDNSQPVIPVTDSKSNTWILLATKDGEFSDTALYYSKLTSVGAAHTFSANSGGAQSFAAIQCMVWSGSHATTILDQTAMSGAGMAAVTVSAGPMTPTLVWELSVSALGEEDANVVSASGYTVYQLSYSLGNYFGVALGWKVQPLTLATNPAWTWTTPMSVSSVAGTFRSTDSVVVVIPPDIDPMTGVPYIHNSLNLLERIRDLLHSIAITP